MSHPIDFASIHGYDNYASQIAAMRGDAWRVSQAPRSSRFPTEYASFSEFPPDGLQSRFGAVMRFFRDPKDLLAYPDVTKVYWAQWLDAGEAPGMGLLTWDGHRKAIFNAFKIYGTMPVDRVATPPGSQGVDLMASADEREAGVVLWNTSATDRRVRVDLAQLPFKSGTVQVFRIDKEHASYLDNPASEHLSALQKVAFNRTSAISWQGTLPAEAVVI